MDKIKKIYTVATAHLDTSWLWTFEKTVEDFIPATLHKNFRLFEKYPDYKFNFEGSYRYELTEEYYPEDFEKLKAYVKEGRWNPCGACYENGDVNVPSPEALFRNILYGNGYFREKFGRESNDIFLPDCFGFGRALPSVAAHSGLTGFSTQKLSWGGAVDVPYDIGRWNGKDGKGLWCALKPGSYSGVLVAIRNKPSVKNNLTENSEKYGLNKTFIYHGTGDRGGAPSERSVRNTVKAVKKNQINNVNVLSATTREFFDSMERLSDKVKAKIPVWNDEFLMTEHGTGSYTSRAVSKRFNRRSELLADCAERFSSAAFSLGICDYPEYIFDTAWKKTIAHQFHDDITGTSFQKCYKRNWNDYVQSMNFFSSEYTNACEAVVSQMDTSFVKGTAVAVSNPLQSEGTRFQSVSVNMGDIKSECVRVFNKDGKEVPSQLKGSVVTFTAEVPSCGIEIYDVRESETPCEAETELYVSDCRLENKYLKVLINDNGDISSVYDKRLRKELLSAPIRPAVLNDVYSENWPAWEVKYKDICSSPYMYAENPVFSVTDKGSALASLKISRTAGSSVFEQVISLGCESEFVSVYNETDWREESSMLKMEFPLSAQNEKANYDIGTGYTKRNTNTARLYEVPAQRWAGITDKSGDFGVAVFSDSRAAWDKPDISTVRLTCVHTPMINYRWECSQHLLDLGLNRYSFGICAHKGQPDRVPVLADEFCQPMHTFITEKHRGSLGKSFSFFSINNENVRVLAVKKAQKDSRIIVRVAEYAGRKQDNVCISFVLPVKGITEMRGDEIEKGQLPVNDGKLVFDLSENEIRTFAVELEEAEKVKTASQKKLDLPFNCVAVTRNSNRFASTLKNGISLPEEIIPDTVLSKGITYSLKKDGESAVICRGQEIRLQRGTASVHFLITSLKGDREAEFTVDENKVRVNVQDCFEAVGAWDLIGLGETGYIKNEPQAFAVTHVHDKEKDLTAKQFYIFHCEIMTDKAKSIILPNDENIVIFSAVSQSKKPVFKKGDEHFDRLKKRKFDYKLSRYAQNNAKPWKIEKAVDRFIDRTKCAEIKVLNACVVQSVGEIYYILRTASTFIKAPVQRRKILKERSK